MSRSNSIAENSIFGYGTSVESIVTNEIVKLVTSSFCGEGLKSTLISLFGKLWKIVVLYGVQYFIKNTKGLSSFLSSLFRLCFYKKITLNIKDNESVDFLFYKKIETFLSTNNEDQKAQAVNGFRMYGQKIDNNVHIEYIPLFHNSFIQNLRSKANESLKDYQDSKEILVNCITSKKKPMELYASKNFIKAARIIQEFFRVKKCRDSFSTQAVLIDGIPGLGKTVFLDYVAYHKLASQIIYANLTREEYRNCDFGACMDKIYNIVITGTCIVHIDEIDKHLDYRIKTKYHDLLYKEEKATPKSSPNDKEEEKPGESSTTPNIPTFEEFRESEKSKFLYQLTDLIESKHFSFGVVIILTSNNFESIFEGVDMTHFHSLKRRFLKVRFEKCDREDFIGYCKFYNDSFKEKCPEKYISENDFEELCSEISPSLEVPFWIIHQEMIGASFSIRDLIKTINNLPSEDPLEECRSDIPKLLTPPLVNTKVSKTNVLPTNVLPTKSKDLPKSEPLPTKKEIPLSESKPLFFADEEEPSKKEKIVRCGSCGNNVCGDLSVQCQKDCNLVLCEKCWNYCEGCDGYFCKEHYNLCEKCENHVHEHSEGEKDCMCCKLCDNVAVEENHCCSCGAMVCENCCDDKSKTFECRQCEDFLCVSHMCKECNLNSQCERCCLELEHTEEQKEEKKVKSIKKYNCEVPDSILDIILKDIPEYTSTKNILSEIKNYEVCGNISRSYIEIVDRIYNCDDCMNALIAFLNLAKHTKMPLKLYEIIKLFEYILSEKCEQFIYKDDKKMKQLRGILLQKLDEFESIEFIATNQKFMDIANEIRTRFARVDRE